MSEAFFQSVEFANLLDALVLLGVLLVAPLGASALGRLTRGTALMLAVAYGSVCLSLGLATYQSAYVLFTQFPAAPDLAHYLEVFLEVVGFWLGSSFLLRWRGARGAKASLWVGGGLVLLVGVSVGIGGWQRTALLERSFHFRREAEVALRLLQGALVLAVLAGFVRAGTRARRWVTWGALLLTLRQMALIVLLSGLLEPLRVPIDIYVHLSLVAGIVLGALALADLEALGVRARTFRIMIAGFVVLSTVVVALSFNYLLRNRLLDESLDRYRGQAEKIGNDIRSYLGRLEGQVRTLAAPEVYAALAYPAETLERLALLPHEFLLSDFRSVGFYTAGGEVLRFYSEDREQRPAFPSLGRGTRERLWQSPEQTLTLARNFISHGSLFYEIDGRLRIRGDRPERQPELVFLAAVRDGAGRESGYVEAVFESKNLRRFFSGYGTQSDWDFVATDRGLLLAHGSSDYVGYDLSWFSDLFGGAASGERWHRITLPGGSSYVVVSPMAGRNWVVGRVVSTQTILGALRKLRGETLIVVILTFAITTLAALLLSGFVSRQRIALERMSLEVEHKRAIEAKNVELAAERQKIETILLSLGEGVIVCDAGERIVFVNRLAEAMLDQPQALLIGQPATSLAIAPLEQSMGEMRAERALGRARPEIQQFVAQVSGLDVRGNIAPIVAESEGFQGAVIILQDITELMKIDRLKTEILSIVSHSLRTPLTSIKSYTEILQAKAQDLSEAKAREYLEVIDLSTDRLTRIVNNILDLSKIAGGKMDYSFRETPLGELLEESARVASGAAESKDIRLRTHWNGGGPTLRLDRSKMMQVFDNILGNAVKFTPRGGQVELGLDERSGADLIGEHGRRDVAPQGRYAVIWVRDTGAGIASQNLERIFDRFFQDDYRGQSHQGGTGLGLAISKEYVLAHGGQIWATSERGSTFYVALPV